MPDRCRNHVEHKPPPPSHLVQYQNLKKDVVKCLRNGPRNGVIWSPGTRVRLVPLYPRNKIPEDGPPGSGFLLGRRRAFQTPVILALAFGVET